MKKIVVLFSIAFLFYLSANITRANADLNINQQKNYLSKYQNTEKIILVFKITGMNTEEDARIVDELLKTTSFIVSSYTDFKTGICKVVTDNIENEGKILEIIGYKASHKVGHKLSAELVETIIEKE